MSILDEIRRILLPEIVKLENKIDSHIQGDGDLIAKATKLEDAIRDLEKKVFKLEMRLEDFEEHVVAKVILNLLRYRQLSDDKK